MTDVTRQTVPAFAHASEAEMARILDFYEIAWEYEPHTFPILWRAFRLTSISPISTSISR